jgi:magnesium-transporting ATPase (P-type)
LSAGDGRDPPDAGAAGVGVARQRPPRGRDEPRTALTWKAVRGTRVVWAAVILVTAAQFAITYLPPLQSVFGTEAIGFVDGLLIVAAGVVLFAILEIEKQLRLLLRTLRSGAHAKSG